MKTEPITLDMIKKAVKLLRDNDAPMRVLYEDEHQKVEGRYGPDIITFKPKAMKIIREVLE